MAITDNIANSKLVEIYRGTVSGIKGVQMTDEEMQRIALVRDRFVFMSQSKSVLDTKFQLEKQLYEVFEQHLTMGEVWNAPYRFADIFGAIQRKANDLIDNIPTCKVRAMSEKATNFAIATQAVVKHTDMQTFAMREKVRALYDCLMYGTGILFEGYFRKDRKVTPAKSDDLLLKYAPSEDVSLYNGLASERIDPRDFFIDETATVFYDETGIQGARDCIRRRSYPYSTFLKTFGGNSDFKYIDAIVPISWGSDPFGRGKIPFEKETQEQKTVQKYVVVLEYWNVELDMVDMVANGIEIYVGANPFKHKRLPFIPYYNYRRDDSCWGISEIEIQAPFLYADEELTNLMILDAKLALQPALAVSGDVMFNSEEEELEPGSIFTLRGLNGGKVQDAIMPLRFGGIPGEALQVRQLIDDKRITVTGDDIRALYSNPQQLATQTKVKRESAQKRIKSNVMLNTIESERNRVEMKVSNIVQFYAKPYQDMDGKVKYRRVKIEGYMVRQDHDEAKPEFTSAYGANGNFTLNPASMEDDSEVEIEVIDSQLDAQMKEEEMADMMQLVNTAMQLIPLNPQAAQQMNIVGLLKQIAKKMDLDYDEVFPAPGGEEGNDEIDLMHDLIMMGEVPQIDPGEDSVKALERHLEFMKTQAYEKARKNVHQAMMQLISLTSKNVKVSIQRKLDTLRRSKALANNGPQPLAVPGQPPEQGGGAGVPGVPGGAVQGGGAPSPEQAAGAGAVPGGMAAGL